MTTKLELIDAKTNILAENDTLFELADTEKRSLTDKEVVTTEGNLQKVKDLDLRIESESRKDSVGKMVKQVRSIDPIKEQFSLIKAINARVTGRELPDVARDLNILAMQEFRTAGVSAVGSIQLPIEVRADILAGTSTAGQEIVAEDKKAILPPLTDKLILAKAGATFLTGLVGNVSVPSYAGTTVAWKGEVAAADDGGGAFTEVNFTPKRLTAVVDVSKLFLAQDGVGAERLLLDNISNAVARKLESTILGVANVSATQPAGMGYAIVGEDDSTPTLVNIVAMETAVDTANVDAEKLAYITNSGGRGILKTTLSASAAGSKMLLEDGEMNGYPVYVTNSCSKTAGSGVTGDLLVFGNWADLCITQWGGYDITVDPYTVANEGQVRIVINAYFDAKGLRGTSNGYNTSFDAMSIKA